MRARPALLLAASVLAVVGAGCSGTTSSAPGPTLPASTRTGGGTGEASASPTGPVATESNPPGDIPDNQAYLPVTVPGTAVSVKVPEGWAKSSTSTSSVFTDKLNRIEIQVTSTAAAPTAASITAADVPKLTAAVPKLTQPAVTSVNRAAGPALLLTYQGDSPLDPVTGKVVRDAFERYTFYRAGTRVDLTLSGPVNADNVDPWRIVSDSLRWGP